MEPTQKTQQDPRPTDVTVSSTGSAFMFVPKSPRAKEWLAENVPFDYHEDQVVRTGMLLASRLILDMTSDGLVVQ